MKHVIIKSNPQTRLTGTTKRGIVIALTHKRIPFYIALNLPPVEPEHLIRYESGSAEISKKAKYYEDIASANAYMISEKNRMDAILLDLKSRNKLQDLTVNELKQCLRNTTTAVNDSPSFYEYADKLIVDHRLRGKENTARTLGNVVSYLKRLKQVLYFSDIDYAFLKQIETRYLSEGKAINGLATKLSYLRAVYNRAQKENMFTTRQNPFTQYSIKHEKTRKRAVNIVNIKELEEYTPNCQREQLAKDIFLFSFHLAGMNYKDMALITHENIHDNRLVYSRGKTADKFDFRLNDKAMEIIERNRSESKYVLPIVIQTNLTGSDLIKHIYNRHSVLNIYSKRIGKKIGLEYPLTSYVARHTFATIAKNKNIPIHTISEMLGHEDIRTTQIYLEGLQSDTKDKYLDEITSF